LRFNVYINALIVKCINTMEVFTVPLKELDFIGLDLHRPKCVLTGKDGSLIVSDWRGGVTRIAPDGGQEAFLPEDNLAEIDRVAGKKLRNISSLAFGGTDRKTAYLGCLSGDQIATFRSPVAGRALPHWEWT
jgi:hypothetical protein